MRSPMGIRVTTVVGALTVLAAIVGVKPPSPAIVPEGAPAGENPEPFSGTAPFSLRTVSPANGSTVSPANGSTVGVAKPIIINFAAPITDRPAVEDAIHVSSDPLVPGKFYWMNDRQVRWRPLTSGRHTPP
jgi:lipoprotein-anchoring transpeptidase ErfK/SrfK